jgi:hypothetical protein
LRGIVDRPFSDWRGFILHQARVSAAAPLRASPKMTGI